MPSSVREMGGGWRCLENITNLVLAMFSRRLIGVYTIDSYTAQLDFMQLLYAFLVPDS